MENMIEKCVYCTSQSQQLPTSSSDLEIYIETNSFTGRPYLYDEYSGTEIEIRFCPMCGRSLVEEE